MISSAPFIRRFSDDAEKYGIMKCNAWERGVLNMNETVLMLCAALKDGRYDAALKLLYGASEDARSRALRVSESFLSAYGDAGNAALFSGPGRTELGGNHTDHQHGHVLCGSVNLDVLACAAPNDLRVIRVRSEGYAPLEVDLARLTPLEEEKNTTAALIRGIAAKLTELGYPVGGFDVCACSNVLSGSGLSSSAAFEVLLCSIFNCFFCGDALDSVEIAKISQYAENVYFGKPCGLMDQMGSSIGGAVAIDFRDPASPIVERVDYDFSRSGHALCIIDTGSTHADLTEDYADITREMGAAAAFFGKRFLRDVPEADVRDALPELRKACGDRAALRALHFFAEDRRAILEAEALKNNAFETFLDLVKESGHSSALYLQNTWSVSAPRSQAISVAFAVGEALLAGTGAIRVHGGGFAGTVQAWVPLDRLDAFREGIEAVFGAGKCHILHVRPIGGCVITPREG